MDATEALLNPVRIPREIVVDHQVGTLEVNALSCCVCSKKDLNVRIMFERLLRLHPFLTTHAAMDDNNRVRTSQ